MQTFTSATRREVLKKAGYGFNTETGQWEKGYGQS